MLRKVADVAVKLNASQSTVYALIEAKRLACFRVGLGAGAIRVSDEQLVDYLKRCEQGQTAEPRHAKPAPRPTLKHLKLGVEHSADGQRSD
jgi:excisionase family DNA binding protein